MKNKLELENQVCTLEQAKKIDRFFKDAEVDAPESYFVWAIKVDVGGGRDRRILISRNEIEDYHYEIYPAFSCAELGVLLSKIKTHFLAVYCDAGIKREFEARMYSHKQHLGMSYSVRHKRESRAKADLFIHLFEQKIIKPEELSYE